MITAFTLFGINLVFIGILPKIFFRDDGAYNLMWFVTAAPFGLCGVVLGLALGDVVEPMYVTGHVHTAMMAAGMVLSAGSIALIAYTLGTHRIPLALWHQDNDAPRSIVTYGAYKRVRHPFYTSFLLCLIGAVIAMPHPLTLACLAYGFAILNHTAAREERNLSASEFGDEYKAYIAHTGRFFPKLSGAKAQETAAADAEPVTVS